MRRRGRYNYTLSAGTTKILRFVFVFFLGEIRKDTLILQRPTHAELTKQIHNMAYRTYMLLFELPSTVCIISRQHIVGVYMVTDKLTPKGMPQR